MAKLMVLHDEIAALKSYWMATKEMPPERHAFKCQLRLCRELFV